MWKELNETLKNDCISEVVSSKPEVMEDFSRPPAKLPPLGLDDAWKAPSLDAAWKTGKIVQMAFQCFH